MAHTRCSTAGKTAEVKLRRFQGMTDEPVVVAI
jgi:hypothetical protein